MADVKKLKYKHPKSGAIYEYRPEWANSAFGKSLIEKNGLELAKEDKPKTTKP